MIAGHLARTFRAFQNRSYRRLWLSSFFTHISQMVQMTLLAWFVLERTDSPFLVALVGAFAFAPTFVLGAVGGLLADQIDRKRLILATQGTNLAAALAFTLLLNTDLVEFWHAYLIMLVVGTGWALDFPSRRSIIHDLLGDRYVTNGMALESVGMQLSWMLGPALAGGLITLVNVAGGYTVVGVFYMAALALMFSFKLTSNSEPLQPAVQPGSREPLPGAARGGGSRRRFMNGGREMLRNIGEGFRYARGKETIRAVILITLIMNLLLYPYLHMVPVIARDTLGVGPGLMGVLMSAPGAGSMLGAVAIAAAGNLTHQGRVFVTGSTLAMTALLLFSLSSSYSLSLPLLMILGLGTAGFGTMQATIIMLVARSEMRGRAIGVMSLAIGIMPLGLLMTGAVASAYSPTFAIGLNASLGLVLIALAGWLTPSLRRPIVLDERRRTLAAAPLPRIASAD